VQHPRGVRVEAGHVLEGHRRLGRVAGISAEAEFRSVSSVMYVLLIQSATEASMVKRLS